MHRVHPGPVRSSDGFTTTSKSLQPQNLDLQKQDFLDKLVTKMFFWAEFNERIKFCASEAKTKFKFKIAAKLIEADLKQKKVCEQINIQRRFKIANAEKKTLFCKEGCC